MPVSLAATAASVTNGAIFPIAHTTLTRHTSDVNFTNIPQTYQDLIVHMNCQKISGSFDPIFGLNADFTVNSAQRLTMVGNGSSALADRRLNDSVVYLGSGSATFGATGEYWTGFIANIFNYRSSIKKTILFRGARDLNSSGTVTFGAASKTIGPVTSLLITGNDANWAAGSSFTLYGVRAG